MKIKNTLPLFPSIVLFSCTNSNTKKSSEYVEMKPLEIIEGDSSKVIAVKSSLPSNDIKPFSDKN